LARRLVHFAVEQGIPPKHLEERLVLLRDTDLSEHGGVQFENLVTHIKDNNFRLFAERAQLHVISAGTHVQGTDPFQMFEQLVAAAPRNVDASHAFYLGFELSKALTALTLGKQYEQDQALDWGFLTTEERHHRLGKRRLRDDKTDPSAPTE
jgi:hypothetical protein